MDAADLIRMQMAGAREWLAGTMDGVTSEQAHWVPPGVANPLGATYAHIVVGEDMIVNALLRGGSLMAATSWAGKTGLSEPMPGPDRWDDYGSWTRRVRLDLPQLHAYAQAVFANTDAYLASLTAADLDQTFDLSALGIGEMSAGAIISRLLIGHIDNEAGEISCLKGLQGARGFPA